jgi:hypothetical protein
MAPRDLVIRKRRWLASAVAMLFAMPAMAGDTGESDSRLATYQTPSGDEFFALSIRPKIDPAKLQELAAGPAEVVILVDTSASQAGPFRDETNDTVRGLLKNLDSADRVAIVAVDVKAVAMSDGLVEPHAELAAAAVKKLDRRLPLGTTNLHLALEQAIAMLPGDGREKSIVYIGDAAAHGAIRDEAVLGELIDQCRLNRISIHGIAVGPTTNVGLLAALANQTGGTVLVSGADAKSADELAGLAAGAVSRPPLWVEELELPADMINVLPQRTPPLRTDRDTILLGELSAASDHGSLVMDLGDVGEQSWALHAEESQADFAFLPGLVKRASVDGGLTLPALGSAGLRETARMMAEASDRLTEASALALQGGQVRGAIEVAREALETDPNNAQAASLIELAGDEERLAALLKQDEGEAESIDNVAPPAAEPPAAGGFDAPAVGQEAPSGILDAVQAERNRLSGRARAEVRAALEQARRQLTADPTGVSTSLKSLLQSIEAQSDLDPAVRRELRSQIGSSIRAAQQREVAFAEAQASAQESQAAAAANLRIVDEALQREQRIKQLVEQFNGLMREGRFREADDEVAMKLQDIAPNTVIGNQAEAVANQADTIDRYYRYRSLRERNFIDVLNSIDKLSIPFVDEPPILYPDAEVWQRLSDRRLARYGSIELTGSNETERRIQQALNETTDLRFDGEPLENVVSFIQNRHNIPIILNSKALDEVGVQRDAPVTVNLPGVSLRSGLRILLRELDLTYMVKDEVLQITSKDDADANLITKVYPVGDLVVPVAPIGGGMMGGMGGGMGGMGGMGGGMGGMGGMGGGMGGMGGMGGGMGGMGGGMGGGMFVVPDDIQLDAKTTAPVLSDAAGASVSPLTVTPASGESIEDAWDRYFAEFDPASPSEAALHAARVRETVRRLNGRAAAAAEAGNDSQVKASYEEVVAVISAGLRHGHMEPWMYKGLALALEGSGGSPEDVERALLSAVDFADTPDDLLNIARHLEASGLQATALEQYRNIARLEPQRFEAYVQGLRLARQLKDVNGIQWACEGLLSQAWPAELQELEAEAVLVAQATYQELQSADRMLEADAFERRMQAATLRDCIVRVSWTGDADIDLLVEEPSGTVCSLENRRSAGGGLLVADGTAAGHDSGETHQEVYVCPKGFNGEYRLLVRRVWGEVSAGHVTIEILTDAGRPTQRVIRQQIPLAEKDALVTFDVRSGQRTEPVAAAQLASLNEQQFAMAGAILAQQAQANANPAAQAGGPFFPPIGSGSNSAFNEYWRDLARFGLARQLGLRPGVGFQPVITTLPEGTMMFTRAIISADRRYVRVSPFPFFSAIPEVSTFNFVTGQTGTNGGGGGGVGGGGGLGGFQ